MANLTNLNNKFLVTTGGNVGIGTTSPSTKLEVLSSQTNSSIRTGGLEMQSYAVNNSWYAENLYYDGAWKLRSNGYATQMYMEAGVISFKRVASGSAGDSVSPLTTMVLDSSGNVSLNGGLLGLGNAASTPNIGYGMFHYNGVGLGIYSSASGATQGIGFWLNNGSAYEAGRFLSNGNLGIGTTSPAKKLEVATTGINQSSTIRIQGTDGNGNGHPLDLKMNGADDSFSILIGQGGGATPSTILFNGNRNGNVGIGTSSPNFKLDIVNAAASTATYQQFRNGTTGTGSGDGTVMGIDADGDFLINNQEAKEIKLYTSDTQRLTIQSGGNVGIGAASPDFALDIEASGSGVQLQIGRTSSNVGSTWMGSDSNGFHLGVGAYGSGNSVSDPNGFTVNTSGELGIGTTSPGSYDNESDDLVVFNSTTPGITIATDNAASRGALRFADGTSGNETYRGALEYNHSGDIMSFRTASVQRMNLTSDGNLVIGGGSAYSGTGVTSLTVNNNSYPTLALGTLSANRFAIIAYGTYNLFGSSNNFVFDSGNVGIGTTSPTKQLHLKRTSGDTMLSIWGLYGIAAMFNNNIKNTSYNLLDIVSKNFYALYLSYKIYNLK